MTKSQKDSTFPCSKEAVDSIETKVSMIPQEIYTCQHSDSPLCAESAESGQQSVSRSIQRFEILKLEHFYDFPAPAPKLHYTTKWRKLTTRLYQMRY